MQTEQNCLVKSKGVFTLNAKEQKFDIIANLQKVSTGHNQGYLEHRDRLLCFFRTFRLTTVVLRSAFRLTIGRLNDRSHCETARFAHCALTKSRARVGL